SRSSFLYLPRPPPLSPLFPYTTLFRSSARMGLRSVEAVRPLLADGAHADLARALDGVHRYPRARSGYIVVTREHLLADCGLRLRSEEHTSELQSLRHLVCRLLLEKKKH